MKIDILLFEKTYDGERNFIPLSDIPIKFLVPENNIMIKEELGRYDSNKRPMWSFPLKLNLQNENSKRCTSRSFGNITKL